MQGTGNDFLSDAALPLNEDGDIGTGHLIDNLPDSVHLLPEEYEGIIHVKGFFPLGTFWRIAAFLWQLLPRCDFVPIWRHFIWQRGAVGHYSLSDFPFFLEFMHFFKFRSISRTGENRSNLTGDKGKGQPVILAECRLFRVAEVKNPNGLAIFPDGDADEGFYLAPRPLYIDKPGFLGDIVEDQGFATLDNPTGDTLANLKALNGREFWRVLTTTWIFPPPCGSQNEEV